MTDKFTINQLTGMVYYQQAAGAHTMSECECGRQSARGGWLCLQCLTEMMEVLGVDRKLTEKWVESIHEEHRMIEAIMDVADEGQVTKHVFAAPPKKEEL